MHTKKTKEVLRLLVFWRTPQWSVLVTLAIALLCGAGALHGETNSESRFGPGVEPFSSDSDLLGSTVEAPFVSINEFTGKVSIRLPAVGVVGLALTPSYVAPNRFELNETETFPYIPEYRRSPLGIAWHLDMGYLISRQGSSAFQGGVDGVHPTWERVAYVDPSGGFTSFTRDGLFQVIPDGSHATEPWGDHCGSTGCARPMDDARFIDASLRRITRSAERTANNQAKVFAGEGTYTLRETDGSTIEFQPTATLDPKNFELYIYSYPISIIAPNGRETKIEYLGGNLNLIGNPRPLIDYIEDSFQRRLKFEYQEIGGELYVERVLLQDGKGAGQLLATFAYQSLDGDVHLESVRTAEGYEIKIGLESGPLPAAQPFPFVNQITTPQGGQVRLEYSEITILKEVPEFQEGCYDRYACLDPNTLTTSEKWVRVSRLEHSGGVFELSYSQEADDALEKPEGWTVNEEYPIAPLTVSFDQIEVPAGEKTYSRKTTYFGFPTSRAFYASARDAGNGLLIGRKALRTEMYCHRDNAHTDCDVRKEDRWIYTNDRFNQCSGDFCRMLHFKSGGSSDGGPALIPLLRKHSSQVDGVWIDTIFEYDSLNGVAWGEQNETNLLYPVAVERSAVLSGGSTDDDPDHPACASPPLTLRQVFEYEHRHGGRRPPSVPVAEDFALGLRTLAEHYAGDLPQQRIETSFDSRWPVVKRIKRHADETGLGVVTEYAYYDAPSPDHGLLQRRTTGGAGQSIKSYEYGMPSRIYPVGGLGLAPPVVREVNVDGTVAAETKNGFQVAFDYDRDRRLIETSYPLDERAVIEYSPPPGQSPSKSGVESCGDNWMESWQANRLSRECHDLWGRVVRTERAVTDSLTAVGRSEINAIGLTARTVGPEGAVVETDFDVWGRPTTIVTFDQDGSAQDPLSYRSFEYFTDPATGIRRVEETMRVTGEASEGTVKITDTDVAGRMVTAGLRTIVDNEGLDAPRTCFEYADAGDGSRTTKVTIKPEHGLTRYRWENWLGQTTKEFHPEIGFSHFFYDSRGLLRERYNTTVDDPADPLQSERHRFTYDGVNRLVKEEVKEDGAYIPIRLWEYDNRNNQLIEARRPTDDPSRAVVTRFDPDFLDAQQRPRRLAISIPEPYEPLAGLRPRGAFLDDRPLLLRWHAHPAADRYLVQLKRPDLPTLAFEVTAPELWLEEGLLDADQDYEWRVRMVTKEHEPSPWSDWAKLRNGCRIESFFTVPGYDQGPLIWWTTSEECAVGHQVRIRVSTLEGTTAPGCALIDGGFSAYPQGIAQRAHFMAIGYNYEDVIAANAAEFDPDYMPEYFGPKDCAPIDEADFRITIEETENTVGGEANIVDSRPPLRARVIHDPEACQITSFYVNDGFTDDSSGQLPEVPEITWTTKNCENHHVEVQRFTVGPEIDPICELFEDVWVVAPNGQELADFMTTGWTGVGGAACSPVDIAGFAVEVRRDSDPESEILDTRTGLHGRIDPDFGGACHIRYFGTRSPSEDPPEIRWWTHGCEDATVQVLKSTVDGAVSDDCGLRDEIFSESHQGPEEALFMATGYLGRHGASCGSLRRADFSIDAFEEGVQLFDRRSPIRTEYTGEQVGGPDASCEVLSFDVANRGDRVPQVSWSTTCDQADSPTVAIRVNTLSSLPAECRVENGTWSGGVSLEKEADFMVGGYGPTHSCPPVEEAEFWLVLSDETGDELFATPSQLGSYDPGADPPCGVESFEVESFPGENRLPEVRWSTDCSPNGSISVQVRTESLVAAPCTVQDQFWDGRKALPEGRPVEYMVGGRGPDCTCPALENAWFWIELVDTSAGDRLVRRTDFKGATYDPPAGPICELQSCGIANTPGQVPVIDWETTCGDVDDSIVRVSTSTLTPDLPEGCELSSAFFSGHASHPGMAAEFMVGGSQPGVTCPPIDEAAFWVQVLERLPSGEEKLVRQSDFMIGTYDGEPPPCTVQAFHVNDQPAGEVPTVYWQTDCVAADQVAVEVIVTTDNNDLPATCQMEKEVWRTGFSGSDSAELMLAGSGADCHCPAIEGAWFQVEIRNLSDGQLVYQTEDAYGEYESTVPCSLLSCSVANGQPAGQLPEVSWVTNCPDPGAVAVQVKTSTISSLPAECRRQDRIWDGDKSDSRPPYFMAGGYGPNHDCPPVERASFRAELWYGDDQLAATSEDMVAVYQPPISPCEILSLTVTNGSPGEVPTVSWSTSCDPDDEGLKVQVLASTLGTGGEGCDWDGDDWRDGVEGSLRAQFMADGITPGCSPVEEAAFWLRIVDTANEQVLYRQSGFVYGEYEEITLGQGKN